MHGKAWLGSSLVKHAKQISLTTQSKLQLSVMMSFRLPPEDGEAYYHKPSTGSMHGFGAQGRRLQYTSSALFLGVDRLLRGHASFYLCEHLCTYVYMYMYVDIYYIYIYMCVCVRVFVVHELVGGT